MLTVRKKHDLVMCHDTGIDILYGQECAYVYKTTIKFDFNLLIWTSILIPINNIQKSNNSVFSIMFIFNQNDYPCGHKVNSRYD